MIRKTHNKLSFDTNMEPLVLNVAKRFVGCGLDLDDLLQEGRIGLGDAINRYKPEKGSTFEYYAKIRVKGSIVDAIRNQHRGSRKDIGIIKLFSKFKTQLCRTPTVNEFAEWAGLPRDQVDEIFLRVSARNPVSLLEGDYALADRIEDTSLKSPEEHFSNIELRSLIQENLSRITPREEFIIREYYFKFKTLKDIGMSLKCTESRVSQIRQEALDKIRSRGKALREWHAVEYPEKSRGKEFLREYSFLKDQVPKLLYALLQKNILTRRDLAQHLSLSKQGQGLDRFLDGHILDRFLNYFLFTRVALDVSKLAGLHFLKAYPQKMVRQTRTNLMAATPPLN